MHPFSHVIRDLRAFFYSLPPNILRSGIAIISLSAVGTVGYMIIEEWTFLDALCDDALARIHPASKASV